MKKFNVAYIFILLLVIAMVLSLFNVSFGSGEYMKEKSVDRFVGLVLVKKDENIDFDDNQRRFGKEVDLDRGIKTIDFGFENLGSIYMIQETIDNENTQNLRGNDPFSNVNITVSVGDKTRYIVWMDLLSEFDNKENYKVFKIYINDKDEYYILEKDSFILSKDMGVNIEGENRDYIIEYNLNSKSINISENIQVIEMDQNLNTISNQSYTFEDLPKEIKPQKETKFFMVTQSPDLNMIFNDEQLRLYGRESKEATVYINASKAVQSLQIPIIWGN